jgi:hypothetical protein
VVLYPLTSIPLYRSALRAIEMPVREYLEALRPALIASAAMTGGVFVVAATVPAGQAPLTRAIIEIAAGMAVYPVALVLARPALFRSAKRHLQSRWRKSPMVGI